MKRVYLDNAASTPLRKEVVKAMKPFLKGVYANPGALHCEGVNAHKTLEQLRAKAGSTISARADELVFTSGGTEANNLAIFGVIEALAEKGVPYTEMHCITSVIEHSSVLEPLARLERKGVVVTRCAVDAEGVLSLETLRSALRPETVLVSVQLANNEIGTVQDVKEISKAIRHKAKQGFFKHSPLLHTDASQAPLFLEVGLESLGADMVTLDAHKIGGPKGIGALVVRRGTTIAPLMVGGGQERGLRSSTESLLLVAGFAEALYCAQKDREKLVTQLVPLSDMLFDGAQLLFPDATINGSREKRLPNNVNISIPNIDGEYAVLQLDAAGFEVSSKSSCISAGEESYVIKALGGPDWRAGSSIRITLGRTTSRRDIGKLLKALKKLVISA